MYLAGCTELVLARINGLTHQLGLLGQLHMLMGRQCINVSGQADLLLRSMHGNLATWFIRITAFVTSQLEQPQLSPIKHPHRQRFLSARPLGTVLLAALQRHNVHSLET
jgi:hypothetical protein